MKKIIKIKNKTLKEHMYKWDDQQRNSRRSNLRFVSVLSASPFPPHTCSSSVVDIKNETNSGRYLGGSDAPLQAKEWVDANRWDAWEMGGRMERKRLRLHSECDISVNLQTDSVWWILVKGVVWRITFHTITVLFGIWRWSTKANHLLGGTSPS